MRLEELVAEQKGQGSAKILRVGLLDNGLEQQRAVVAVPEGHEQEVDDLAQKITQLIEQPVGGGSANRQVQIAALALAVSKLLKNQET